jgi:hypothetical protein
MNKTKLKERLIKEIQNIENEDILKEVYRLLDLESEDLESYKLSQEQVSVVNEARDQVKNGQFLTHEEAQKKINQWLNK